MESQNQTVENQCATVTPPNLQVAKGSGQVSKGYRERRADIWKHFVMSEILDGKNTYTK